MDTEDADITTDNRDLVDNNLNQKLTQQEILAMQDTGASGETIIKALVQNSASYQSKTEFSKAKYLKKKAKKCVCQPAFSFTTRPPSRHSCLHLCCLFPPPTARHILVLEVLEPSLDNIIAAYFNRKPSSVWYESRVVWLM